MGLVKLWGRSKNQSHHQQSPVFCSECGCLLIVAHSKSRRGVIWTQSTNALRATICGCYDVRVGGNDELSTIASMQPSE